MDFAACTAANSTKVLAAEARGDAVVEAEPMRYVLELTADCNLHCFMCSCEMLRDKARDVGIKRFGLPVEVYRKMAERFFPTAHQVNPTVVGEPFVLAYFDELVADCERYHVKLDIHTNGMLMRGPRLRRLLPNAAEIRVSFDGGTKPVFDHIRTGAEFEQVVQNLAELAALRRELGLRGIVRTSFNVTILYENVDELARIVEIAAEHDIDVVRMCYMIVFGEDLRSSSPFRDPARTNRALRLAQRRGAELGIQVDLPAPLPVPTQDAELPPPLPLPRLTDKRDPAAYEGPRWMPDGVPAGWGGKYYCRYPWREAFINQGGDVAPCCGQGRPIVGNAFSRDFAEIWNGPEYQRLRRGLWDGDLTDYCRDCPFLQANGAMPYRAETHERSV
ncbi:MAG: radical SAM protein [Planctomycetota bacterium]